MDRQRDSFVSKELKFGRRWLAEKGVLFPEESRDPVDASLDSFFRDIRHGGRPAADVEVGLADSVAVILANKAMDEQRLVHFSEFEAMGREGRRS